MATFEFHIDDVEDALDSAQSMGKSAIFLDHELDLDEIIDWISDHRQSNDYQREALAGELVESGYVIWPDDHESATRVAIGTLRYKITTLGLYPEMTALDVLDYIEEAIK